MSIRMRFGCILGACGLRLGSALQLSGRLECKFASDRPQVAPKSAHKQVKHILPMYFRMAGMLEPALSIYWQSTGRPNHMSAPPKSFHPLHVNSDRKQIFDSFLMWSGSILNVFWNHFGSMLCPFCVCQVGSNANSLRIGPKSAPSRLISKLNTFAEWFSYGGRLQTTGNQRKPSRLASVQLQTLPIC